MMGIVIECKDLEKYYEKTKALINFNCTFEESIIYGVF
jgi:ABC-type multidrug transport system ATPase subunit